MFRFSALKIITVVLLVVASIIYTIPNLWSESTRAAVRAAVPSWVPSILVPYQAIPLGLDLRGGVHVLMEVDMPDLIRGQVRQLQDDVRRVLRENRIAVAGGVATLPRGVQVRVPEAADRARALPRLRDLSQPVGNAALGQSAGNSLNVVEDGEIIRLELTEAGARERVSRAVTQAQEVVRRRVDALGTTEPNIQRQGPERILVQVPGLNDPQRLKEILGSTAKLEFRLVADPAASPAETEALPDKENPGRTIVVERRVMVQGEDLVSAEPSFDQRTGEPVVNFRFNLRGAQIFGRVTTDNVGKPFAIILDNQVISAPRIISPITGGSGQISGRFTVQQANDLAILLRAGALPARMTIVEERTVGPGLGQDSIEAGRLAAIIAGALVAIYMIATYGVFGIFANIALTIHILLILGIMALMGATLTLPGIAGIVLTIGTAVDANVLIYERMREESRLGRSLISALDAGFTRAFATIMDSNVTMFIAAAILFFLGTGPVRGFAVTMIVGILTTVITAVTMTRMMIALWYRYAKPVRVPF